MGFFSSITEKLGQTFSTKKVIAISEHTPMRQPSVESELPKAEPVVVPIDREQRNTGSEKTPRQESAKLLNEIFTEVKNIEAQQRTLNEARWGKGVIGELWKELCTTVHGNALRLTLLGEAAFFTQHAVQSEAFSQLGPATPVAAVLATTLIARESIKTISEVVDYYFRGERSQRKLLEQERQKVKKYKNEKKLTARHHREGLTSKEEYIHYAADLAKKVRVAEETIFNGSEKCKEDDSQFPAKKTKEIIGVKKSTEQERGKAMARSIMSTVAAPIVSVLGGLPLGINEWDGVTPAHNVMASLKGVQFYTDKIPTTLSSIPGQAWTAFAVGATGLISRAIQEISNLHANYKPESKADGAIQSMEASLERIRQCQKDIQSIASVTPRPGKNLNAESMETLRHSPAQAAPNDFSDLAAVAEANRIKEEKRAQQAAKPSFMEKILGRSTKPLKPAADTTPLTAQDFGESPSLFRAETIRKGLGITLAPGTLLSQEAFMGHLEGWFVSASDTDVIEHEAYFSAQLHQHADLDVDETIKTALDEASRRCAAERLNRIAEKMSMTKFDPNTLRARLLVLLGMEDETAVGQKYFEKLFAQGYANASRINRIYFNEVMRALDLSLQVNEASRKREKNMIFESVRAVIANYESAQEKAA